MKAWFTSLAQREQLFVGAGAFIVVVALLYALVWMPLELKKSLAREINSLSRTLGLGDDFIRKIADESSASTEEDLADFLRAVRHPALELGPMT